MSEATRRPWQCSNRDFRGQEHPHNWYITGDHCESSYEDDEDGNPVDTGPVCVGIAIVPGNATSGKIPEDTARLIVRAVNAHEALLAACKEAASAPGKDWLAAQLMLCKAIAAAEQE